MDSKKTTAEARSNNFSEDKPFNSSDSLKIVSGSVVGYSHRSNTLTVKIGNAAPVKAVWCAGMFSGLMGIRCNWVPELGTNVKLLIPDSGDIALAIGSTPLGVKTTNQYGSLSSRACGAENYSDTQTNTLAEPTGGVESHGDDSISDDLVPGEAEFKTLYGNAVQVLLGLCRMRGSELSVVETHVLDDLVRIISKNYEHISSFGNYSIKNDGGKLSVVWEGSSLDHEAQNLLKERTEPSAEQTGKNNIPLESMTHEDLSDVARWRFSHYVGHLGNFIHTFVSDPPRALASLAGDSTPSSEQMRSGRFNFHVNDDGSVLCQSVSDIVLERVVSIPVPIKRRTDEDPEGNKLFEDQFKSFIQTNPLQNWEPEDSTNLHYTAYKLRDYSRWFSNFYSLANFLRRDSDYYVPSQAASPQPDRDCLSAEKKSVNSGYSDSVHTAYINRYATIRIFKDGSIVLLNDSGSSVVLAGDNVQVSARGSLNLEAFNNINLIAGNSINALAKHNIDMTAVNGGMLFRAKNWFQSIVERGTMLFESRTDHDEDSDEVRQEGEIGILLKTSNSNIELSSNRSVRIRATLNFAVKSIRSYINSIKTKIGENFSVGAGSADLNGTLRLNNLFSRIISSSTLIEHGGDKHRNHIGNHAEGTNAPDVESNEDLEDLADAATPALSFRHRESYGEDELLESYTQQELNLTSEGEDWLWSTNGNGTIGYPFPGPSPQHKAYRNPNESAGLNQPSANTEFKNSGKKLASTPVNFKSKI